MATLAERLTAFLTEEDVLGSGDAFIQHHCGAYGREAFENEHPLEVYSLFQEYVALIEEAVDTFLQEENLTSAQLVERRASQPLKRERVTSERASAQPCAQTPTLLRPH